MPIPKAELTPQWHQPNSRGYNGHVQRFSGGFSGGFAGFGFGSFGGTEGLNAGEIAAAQLMSRTLYIPLETAYESARANKAGFTDDASAAAAGYQVNSTGGAGISSSGGILDAAAAQARALAARLQAGGGSTSGGYDTSGGYSPGAPGSGFSSSGLAAKLKDPKVLALGAAVLLGALLLMSPKKKGAAT